MKGIFVLMVILVLTMTGHAQCDKCGPPQISNRMNYQFDSIRCWIIKNNVKQTLTFPLMVGVDSVRYYMDACRDSDTILFMGYTILYHLETKHRTKTKKL